MIYQLYHTSISELYFVFLGHFTLCFWGKLRKLKFRLQKGLDFICIRLNKLSYHTQKKQGLLLVVLEEEVIVGVALDMDGFDAIVHQLFEGVNVALLAGRDEDTVFL